MKRSLINYVFTQESNCVGCNKCIFVCPTKADKAIWINDTNKVIIEEGKCISCGECLSICDHNARSYFDDCDDFFDDLASGIPMTLIIAPAAHTNYPELEHLIGYFKSLGVEKVVDVSLGADICTWAHVRAIEQGGISTMISQPCPVVVNYVEKVKPSLIPFLSPYHSPAQCLAIYLRQQKKWHGKIAFLSPCIGKKIENDDINTHGNINYNITFSMLNQYLKKNKVILDNYPKSHYDNSDLSYGFAYPRPGGLKENLKFYLGDKIWIKNIEGITHIQKYLDEYEKDLQDNHPVPLLVDALNCSNGCNLGTATDKNLSMNAIDHQINQHILQQNPKLAREMLHHFDGLLRLEDYQRTYTDKSDVLFQKTINNIENVFIELGKLTEEDRRINCFSCGYGSCLEFAKAISKDKNHKNNCRFYLLNKFKRMSYIDDLTSLKNRHSYHLELENLATSSPLSVGIAFVDINGLKEANDTYGHKYGDLMISTCAIILKNIFPGMSFRVGGDEFIILTKDLSEHQFEHLIQQLHDKFKNEDNLFVSIGTAWSNHTFNIQDLVETADKNMYTNKQAFYDRVKPQ